MILQRGFRSSLCLEENSTYTYSIFHIIYGIKNILDLNFLITNIALFLYKKVLFVSKSIVRYKMLVIVSCFLNNAV